MRRGLLLALASLALIVAPAFAGNLEGDSVAMCDLLLQPTVSVRPSTLSGVVAPRVADKNFDGAYRVLAQALGQAVAPAERGTHGVDRFLRNLHRARDFDIADFQVSRAMADPTKEHIFQAHPDQITIDCTPPVPQQLVDLAAISLQAARVRAVQAAPDLETIAAAVSNASLQAESLLENGLPMWPWELWLNGLRLSARDSDPLFRTQWVFMRPTAGIEIDTRNRASGDLNASVAIEPVGFVHYLGKGHSEWWGASVVVTSSTSRGAGIGGLLRYNNYVLGVTHHRGERRGEDGSQFLFVGVELHDFIGKKRAQLEDWQGLKDWKAAKEKLSN